MELGSKAELNFGLEKLYSKSEPFINLSKFNVTSWQELYEIEGNTTSADIFDYITSKDGDKNEKIEHLRMKRNSGSYVLN